jgi:type IV pilus assembly protein PilB
MTNGLQDPVLVSLVAKNLIAADAAANVQQQVQAGSDLRSLLVEGGLVNEEQFTQVQAEVLGMPYVDLHELAIPKDVLSIIPESTARGHMVIAYEQTAQDLKVAMANPNDRQIVEFIHKKVDMPVTVALTSQDGIRTALSQYQETLQTELQNLVEEATGALGAGIGLGRGTQDLNQAAEDLPIVKITGAILKHAILQNASDIHIEPAEDQVVVRYRIDGLLHDVLSLPRNVSAGLVARVKVLSKLKIDEHRLPQDGRFKIETDDYKVSFRVSILPVYDGEKVVMRLLDESGRGLSLEEVGMGAKILKLFQRNIKKPNGMVLVTGPTGSGKTTTLYAAIREINRPEVNISTIEDPIEYRMERINQTQVYPKIGLTFSNGLRSLVRQDPDVIMVGEIRDEETASLAVNAALTGHLVLSTLHTNSAAGAIPRLIDMSVEPFLIASTVNLLVAQRLVRRLCEDCRQEAKVNKTVLDSLKLVIDPDELLTTLKRQAVVSKDVSWSSVKIYVPGKCNKCTDGYRGRVGIYEALENTTAIQELITANVTSQAIQDVAREQQQMITMVEDGIGKVVAGVTSIEEVLRVAKE